MHTYTIHHGTAKPMRAIGANQCRLLQFAEKFPGWHTFKQDRATVRAIKALQAKGYLEVAGDQFRLVYPQ